MAKAVSLLVLVVILSGCASSGTPLVYRHPTTGETIDCNAVAREKAGSDLPSSTWKKVITYGTYSIAESVMEKDERVKCERSARQAGYVCVSGC